MNLYIGDLHFGRENVIRFDDRPFANVREMDSAMIRLWNQRAAKEDDVYILGDFAFRNEHPFLWYLEQLAGRKHLIVGNHDQKLLKDPAAMSCFDSVECYMDLVDQKRRVILCHYPMAEWNGFYRGSYHIYGHIHQRTDGAYQYMKQFDHALNAAACINHYIPCSLEELIRNNQLFKEQNCISGENE